jgi:hypothetical protein
MKLGLAEIEERFLVAHNAGSVGMTTIPKAKK